MVESFSDVGHIDCMLKEFIAEFVGSCIFFFIILTQASPIPIAVGLLASIFAFGHISGGHFNPAVSFMIALKDSTYFSWAAMLVYIVAQLIGAGVALRVYNYTRPVYSPLPSL